MYYREDLKTNFTSVLTFPLICFVTIVKAGAVYRRKCCVSETPCWMLNLRQQHGFSLSLWFCHASRTYMPRNWKEGRHLVLSYRLSTCVSTEASVNLPGPGPWSTKVTLFLPSRPVQVLTVVSVPSASLLRSQNHQLPSHSSAQSG